MTTGGRDTAGGEPSIKPALPLGWNLHHRRKDDRSKDYQHDKPCATANGGSDKVGAIACRLGTFLNACATVTKTRKYAADRDCHDVDPAPDAGEMKHVAREDRAREGDQ